MQFSTWGLGDKLTHGDDLSRDGKCYQCAPRPCGCDGSGWVWGPSGVDEEGCWDHCECRDRSTGANRTSICSGAEVAR